MEFMGERSLQEQFEIYISNYSKSKIAFDEASKNYFGLDDSDFDKLSDNEIDQLEKDYTQARHNFEMQSVYLASFVADHKDCISFNN